MELYINWVVMDKDGCKGILPRKAHDTDAGFDLFAPTGVTIGPHSRIVIPLAVGWEPSRNDCYLQLASKSGLSSRGIECCAGVIDCGYRGEISCVLHNYGDSAYIFNAGDKVCQAVPLPLFDVHTSAGGHFLTGSERGAGGFGSTGA